MKFVRILHWLINFKTKCYDKMLNQNWLFFSLRGKFQLPCMTQKVHEIIYKQPCLATLVCECLPYGDHKL